jgi:TrpR-related protein YerC/YecD
LQSENTDKLFEAILSLDSKEECYRFFEDVCTIGELTAMSLRFDVAHRLDSGETFSAIAEKTGASSATIARVNKCLLYGADGYGLVLKRIKKQ